MWENRFLEYLESECNRSSQTVRTYRTCLEELRHYLDGLDGQPGWAGMDADMVRNWMVEAMERGMSPRTVGKHLSALKTFYRYLMRTCLVTTDPVHALQGPKTEKPLPHFVREREMDQLLDGNYFPDTLEGMRDHLILLVLYSTGIRRSELCGLDWADVDLGAMQMRVTGKRNKQRIVPFGPEMRDALAAYRDAMRREYEDNRVTGPLFTNLRSGRRIADTMVYKTVHHYLSYLPTLKKRSPHVLRHSFATAMLNNQANLQSVKELLGHENLATTEIYTHTTFEELKRMYNQAHPRANKD